MGKSKLIEMNNVDIVVENLDKAISFFTEIGLTLEGRIVSYPKLRPIKNTKDFSKFAYHYVERLFKYTH